MRGERTHGGAVILVSSWATNQADSEGHLGVDAEGVDVVNQRLELGADVAA